MRAVCVGSAMVDIIAIVASRDVERLTMHNATASYLLLEQGRKIEAESISTHIGGGAVNAAVCMARLGVHAEALIKIGTDANGAQIIDRLASENVSDARVIKTGELPTGTAVMVSSHDRNATIFTQRGTNTLLRPSEITAPVMADCDLVYITNLSNRSADCFPVIARMGREAGAFVAANPGIRQLTSRTAAFMETLQHIDLLAINRVEAEALVPAAAALSGTDTPAMDANATDTTDTVDNDAPRLMRLGLAFGGFDMSLNKYFSRLREQGVGKIVITDGTHGSYLADHEGIHYCPCMQATPRGTAGAGDAFISTLCARLADGGDAASAMQSAAINAAAVVEAVDTQSGLLTADTMKQRLETAARDLPVTTWAWIQ